MKKYESNKARKLLLASLAIPIVLNMIPVQNVQASDSDIPSLIVYELNGSPKLEWATEMLNENVIMSTGFETGQKQPNFYIGSSGHAGNQSLVNANGNTFIQVLNTFNNTGNYYYYPNKSSHLSAFNFESQVNYMPNGTNLSLTFKARTNGDSVFGQALEHPLGDYPIVLKDNLGNNILFATDMDFRNGYTPKEIQVYSSGNNGEVVLDRGTFRTLANSKNIYRAYGSTIYNWNQDKQKFVLDNPDYAYFAPPSTPSGKYEKLVPTKFNKGESLMTPEWINVVFESRNIKNDGEWHTYNINAYLNHDNYDFNVHGFKTMFFQGTNSILDIDDIKFGHATEVEVYREGQSIYRGYLSDFHDTAITDRIGPNKVDNVTTKFIDNQLQFNWVKPNDNGVTTNYTIQSIAKNGNRSALSQPQAVTLKSDVVKYRYSISKNKEDTPTTTVSVNEFSLPINQLNLVNDYLHIQAIDSNGNVSDVSHFKVSDLVTDDTLQDIYAKLDELENSKDYDDFQDFIDDVENMFGGNLPQDIIDRIDSLGKYHGVNTSFLLLEQGEFTLQTNDINDFGQVKLTSEMQTVMTGFAGDFGVIDASGTQKGWKVNVTASPFTEDVFDGFVGTPNKLPLGSLTLNTPSNIERVGNVYKQDGLPTSQINDYTVIDNGAVTLLSANKGEGLGQFKFNFDDNSLALKVDAKTAKIDNKNYPGGITPYTSTITWDLITGP